MGQVVSTRLRKVTTALETGDPGLAARIADRDPEINALYLDLERDCLDLFARQQPVATDLRTVAASFKILTDLERIADLVTNLADYVVVDDRDLFADLGAVDLLGVAIEMLDDALAAYATGDVETCYAVAARDDELDDGCEAVTTRIIRDIVDRSTDAHDLDPLFSAVTRVLLTVRDVERIGDHAVNIAARTLYLVESDGTLI